MVYKLGFCDEAMKTGKCFEIDGEFYACGKVCSPSNMQKGKIYFAESIEIPDVSMIQTESDVTDDTAIVDKKLDPREDWDLETMNKMQKPKPTSTEKTCANAILDNDQKSTSVWRKLKESISVQNLLNFKSLQMEKMYCPTCKLDLCQPNMNKMQESLPLFCQGCSSYLLQEDTASENALDSLVEALTGESGENIPEKGKIRVLDHMVKNTPFTFLCGSMQSSSVSFSMSHPSGFQSSIPSSEYEKEQGKYSKEKILAGMPFPDSSDSSSQVALASHTVEINENTENEMTATDAVKNKELFHEINDIELTEEKRCEEQKQGGIDTSLSMELQASITFDEENKILHNSERVHKIGSSAILKVSSENKHLSEFMCERCRMPMINVDEAKPVCVTCPLIHREARRNALNKRFDINESTDVGCLVENPEDEESRANTSDMKEPQEGSDITEDICPVSDDCENFSTRFGFDHLPISYSDCEVLEKVHTIVLDTNENRNERPKVQSVDWQPNHSPEDILCNVEDSSSSSQNESFISSQRSQEKDLKKMMNLHELKTASCSYGGNASSTFFTDKMFDTLSPSTNTVLSLETSKIQHFQTSAYDLFGDKANRPTVKEEISNCNESQGGFSSICDRINASFDRVDDVNTSPIQHYSQRIEKPRNHIRDMNKTSAMDNLWLSNTSKIADEDAYIFSPRRRARTRQENKMEVYQSLSSKYGESTEILSKENKKKEKSMRTGSISNRSTKSATRTKPCPEAPLELSTSSINGQRSLPWNNFDTKTELRAHSTSAEVPNRTHPVEVEDKPILTDEKPKYEQNKSHDDTSDESDNEHLLSLLNKFKTISAQISQLDDDLADIERNQKAANSHKSPVLQDLSNNKTVGKGIENGTGQHVSKGRVIDAVPASNDVPIDSLLGGLETIVSAIKEVERNVQEEKVRIRTN